MMTLLLWMAYSSGQGSGYVDWDLKVPGTKHPMYLEDLFHIHFSGFGSDLLMFVSSEFPSARGHFVELVGKSRVARRLATLMFS